MTIEVVQGSLSVFTYAAIYNIRFYSLKDTVSSFMDTNSEFVLMLNCI